MSLERPCVVLNIQVGVAKRIQIQGRQVLSAIEKKPLCGRINVDKLGLKGDVQADLSVHGGLLKAVYAYPSEHYAYWKKQALSINKNVKLPYGTLGENLTIRGLVESEVFAGDELHFQDCILRITQPRQPCFKFNAVMNDKLASKKMAQTGFRGFYLSVKNTGSIAVGDEFDLIPGTRETSIASLLSVCKFKARND
jgi:MOSC domain-containing protein YiiM